MMNSASVLTLIRTAGVK